MPPLLPRRIADMKFNEDEDEDEGEDDEDSSTEDDTKDDGSGFSIEDSPEADQERRSKKNNVKNGERKEDLEALTDEERLITSPLMKGFDLKTKEWCTYIDCSTKRNA